MKTTQKPAYQSPGLKTINISIRRGVCQQASLDEIAAYIAGEQIGGNDDFADLIN